MSSYSLANGEVVEVLRDFRDCSFDALMCDPPYGFRFMGKAWDYDVPSVDLWRECLRVLKPGAPLVAFGGSRTYHRLACGVEDAGFELRDCMMWLHGKGFPKSQDVSKAIDAANGDRRPVIGMAAGAGSSNTNSLGGGAFAPTYEKTSAASAASAAWTGYGTTLKPAHEPIVLARKPLEGTMAANVGRWGVGGLNIDGCRIGWAGPEDAAAAAATGFEKARQNKTIVQSGSIGRESRDGTEHYDPEAVAGRWPANLILDDEAGAMLDASVFPTTSVPYPANSAAGAVLPITRRAAGGYADSGGPSRFFYCAKVSTKEREAGCDHLPKRSAGEATEREDGTAGLDNPRAGAGRTGGARNHHPTLKPLSLTTWLARLIMPPSPGVILVPFAGAGSEMIGALQAGWGGVFGIEREAEYVEIARARLRHWVPESEAA